MSNYSFRKFKPLSLRLWHWLNMTVILGLLGTVLIRKTFLSWRTNAALIEGKLNAAGTVITPELAKEIAVAIRDPLWDWHINFGFALAFLLLLRILIALFVEKSCPGVHALKTALGVGKLPAGERVEALHYSLVKIGYAAFYVATALMALMGFMQYFKTGLGLSKDFVGTIKEAHELMMWFFVVFAIGHIVGLVVTENRSEPGLISDMIHGGGPK